MRAWAIVSVVLVSGAAAGWVFVRGGAYDVAATTSHWQATYSLLETVMQHSVRRRAQRTPQPASSSTDAAATLARGGACFAQHCVLCHGAPGVAPAAMAGAMQPPPPPLVDAARRWNEAELYWITRNGIRMSGMPAWEYRMSDEDLWALARFVARLPELSPRQYAQMQSSSADGQCPAGNESRHETPQRDAAPSIERGRAALRQYGCRGCHVIDGIVGSPVAVGPALDGIARREVIAGRLPNTSENMVRWIQAPARWKPGTAMPALDVTDADALDMAAYLATLR